MIESAAGMIDVANDFSAQPIGREAAEIGSDILVYLMQQPQPGANAEREYGRAVEVLIDKYPTLAATHNQRLFYAYLFLMPRGEHQRTAEVLADIPREHPDYFLAQRLRLYELFKSYQTVEGDAADTMANEIAAEAERLRSESDEDALKVAADKRGEVLAAAGHARLILSDLAAQQGDPAQAVRLLRNFENDYKGNAELIEEALARRIDYHAQAGDYAGSEREARTMINEKAFAQNAAGVIERVVTRMDDLAQKYRIEIAKPMGSTARRQLQEKEQAVTGLAVKLAQMLVDHAAKNNADPAQQAFYQLILGRALRNSGTQNYNRSEEVLSRIQQANPGDAEILFELAETRFAIGGGFRGQVANRDKLYEAAKHYKTLIDSLRAAGQGGYPTMYFVSWLRWFQICDLLGENTEDIGLTIRQLRAGTPNLGGEPWKSEFDKLFQKYPPR